MSRAREICTTRTRRIGKRIAVHCDEQTENHELARMRARVIGKMRYRVFARLHDARDAGEHFVDAEASRNAPIERMCRVRA